MMYRNDSTPLKAIKFLALASLCMTLPCLAMNPAAYPGLGTANQGQPQNQALMPDDAAAQAKFEREMEQVMAELQDMPEEQLKDILKEQLNAMTPEARKDFDDTMNNYWASQGVPPEMIPSFDEILAEPVNPPVTPEPVNPEPAAEAPVVAQPLLKESAAVIRSEKDVAQLLDSTLDHFTRLQRKTTNKPEALKTWLEVITDLVFYLKIIHKPEHHKRLTTKEFSSLYTHIKELRTALARFEPLVVDDSSSFEYQEEDPYELLRVSPKASQEEITETYETYLKERDLDTLRARLTEQGASEDDIEGQIKSAQLSLSSIEDAYEQLNDPKVRAQTDRRLSAIHKQKALDELQTKEAISEIINSLSTAVYKNKLLDEFEEFSKKYEPTELALKKKMVEAEAKMKKNQEEARRVVPSTNTVSHEPFYPPAAPNYAQQAGNQQYYPSPYDYQDYPYYQPYNEGSQGGSNDGGKKDREPRESKPRRSDVKEKDKKADDEQKKLENEMNKKSASGAKKKSAEEKGPEKKWRDSLKAFTDELATAQQTYQTIVKGPEIEAVPDKLGKAKAAEAAAPVKPVLVEAEEFLEKVETTRAEFAKANQETADKHQADLRRAVRGTQQERKEITDAYNEYVQEINDSPERKKLHADIFATAKRLQPQLGKIFTDIKNMPALDAAAKQFANATEDAQEAGVALPYRSTWRDTTTKYRDIVSLLDAMEKINKAVEQAPEEPAKRAVAAVAEDPAAIKLVTNLQKTFGYIGALSNPAGQPRPAPVAEEPMEQPKAAAAGGV